jgi:3-isopropylmalate/(R)-2-methylmalate dehydratase small subunit
MTGGSRIDQIEGCAIVLRGDDTDTDRIMPARFLKAITFSGLEAHLFEDDRVAARANGPRHPFDAPGAAGARVLITGANFGCGSSREHAPQALYRWGLRAILGESFAEIFLSNSLAIGLPCLQLAAADLDEARRACERDCGTIVRLCLSESWADWGAGRREATMSAAARDSFLSGQWDATGLLVADAEDVTRVANALPYVRGF